MARIIIFLGPTMHLKMLYCSQYWHFFIVVVINFLGTFRKTDIAQRYYLILIGEKCSDYSRTKFSPSKSMVFPMYKTYQHGLNPRWKIDIILLIMLYRRPSKAQRKIWPKATCFRLLMVKTERPWNVSAIVSFIKEWERDRLSISNLTVDR